MGGASSGETVKPHTIRAINAAIMASTTTAAPTGLTYRVSLSCFPTFMNFVPSCSCRSMLSSTPSASSPSSWRPLSRIWAHTPWAAARLACLRWSWMMCRPMASSRVSDPDFKRRISSMGTSSIRSSLIFFSHTTSASL